MQFTRVTIVLTALFAMLLPVVAANAASSQLEIISISEVSDSSVEILFNSNVPKKQLSYYVINAAIELSVVAPQNSKTQNVVSIVPKNINKVIKTKATGLITAEIKNLNPKAAYNFSISAKTNKGKMISSAAVEYFPINNLIDAISNLPADWGNPKPIQLPTPTPTSTPIAAPAFTLSSSSETRTVNTAATGFTINSTGGAIASFAINSTPPGMSFNTTTGALTGTPNTVAGATAYTVTATNASGSTTQTFTLTVTAVVYTVGQTGPGGGKIFYVAATPFTCGPTRASTCNYLEVAPNGWNGTADDPQRGWAHNDFQNTSVPGNGATATAIGWGYRNTLAIVDQGNNATALVSAALANTYTVTIAGNVYDDWFLPSKDEINELYLSKSAIAFTLPVNVTFPSYHSSTEDRAGFAFARNLSDGYANSDYYKYSSAYVRPIRAF
jgi:hypothetical protein